MISLVGLHAALGVEYVHGLVADLLVLVRQSGHQRANNPFLRRTRLLFFRVQRYVVTDLIARLEWKEGGIRQLAFLLYFMYVRFRINECLIRLL